MEHRDYMEQALALAREGKTWQEILTLSLIHI